MDSDNEECSECGSLSGLYYLLCDDCMTEFQRLKQLRDNKKPCKLSCEGSCPNCDDKKSPSLDLCHIDCAIKELTARRGELEEKASMHREMYALLKDSQHPQTVKEETDHQ